MAKKVFRDVKEFTVVRKDWLRGDQDNSQLLRDSDKKMCCLGFYALACGVPRKHILDRAVPLECSEELDSINNRWDTFLLNQDVDTKNLGNFEDSKEANELMKINDAQDLSDKDRESRLKKLFAKNGVKVKFINK